jgi:hypothetical protein
VLVQSRVNAKVARARRVDTKSLFSCEMRLTMFGCVWLVQRRVVARR